MAKKIAVKAGGKESKVLEPATSSAKVGKSKPRAQAQPEIEEFPSSEDEDYSASEDEDVNEDEDESVDEFEGFESTDDEADEENKQPAKKVDEKSIKDKIAKLPKRATEKKGVVYVGRIPHGFYETQMKAYFSQFGDITRLRLSRNKKTGQPKHYAFIEFESSEIARIVSETMDNYLLFGHILKVKLIPLDKVHENLFKGSNKKYRPIPWDKVSKYQHDKPKTAEQLKKLDDKFKAGNKAKAEKLKELGLDYSFESAPKVATKVTKATKKTKGRVAKK